MSNVRSIVLTVSALAALAGCGSANVSPNVVRAKAASDLSCPADQLQLENPVGSNWKAKGCGKEATYACSGSNFMSEGMCMRDH
jgi:hypothetical protein